MIETESIDRMGADQALARQANEFFVNLCRHRYSYHFDWMGRPIVQFPQDIVAMQELVWQVRPDVIVETGIAHGGSLVFSASMLALLDMADAIAAGATMDPGNSRRRVVGVDIDIRPHNRAAIEAHPMASRIRMIQGSSIDPATVAEVHRAVQDASPRRRSCVDSSAPPPCCCSTSPSSPPAAPTSACSSATRRRRRRRCCCSSRAGSRRP